MLERGLSTSPKMAANANNTQFSVIVKAYFGIAVLNIFRFYEQLVAKRRIYHIVGLTPGRARTLVEPEGVPSLRSSFLGSYRLINTKNRGSRL